MRLRLSGPTLRRRQGRCCAGRASAVGGKMGQGAPAPGRCGSFFALSRALARSRRRRPPPPALSPPTGEWRPEGCTPGTHTPRRATGRGWSHINRPIVGGGGGGGPLGDAHWPRGPRVRPVEARDGTAGGARVWSHSMLAASGARDLLRARWRPRFASTGHAAACAPSCGTEDPRACPLPRATAAAESALEPDSPCRGRLSVRPDQSRTTTRGHRWGSPPPLRRGKVARPLSGRPVAAVALVDVGMAAATPLPVGGKGGTLGPIYRACAVPARRDSCPPAWAVNRRRLQRERGVEAHRPSCGHYGGCRGGGVPRLAVSCHPPFPAGFWLSCR